MGCVYQRQSAVTLRITPADSSGLTGSPISSPFFDLGNAPPSATIETSQLPQRYIDLAPIEFSLSDSAGDPVDVVIQFRRN